MIHEQYGIILEYLIEVYYNLEITFSINVFTYTLK